jgi:D-arabinose 1-dehydrogenase-like Zn-dependent alcohol dehydrogenase
MESAMSRMRAIQVKSANGPFEIVERDIPEPPKRHVRIRVQACGVCHSDAVTKMGAFPGILYPRVPGHEVVGILDAVGAEVPEWQPGQRVGVGWYGGHCGYCREYGKWALDDFTEIKAVIGYEAA